MRCLACDVALTDTESVRKTGTGHYIDLCDQCFSTIKDELFEFSGVEGSEFEQENNDE